MWAYEVACAFLRTFLFVVGPGLVALFGLHFGSILEPPEADFRATATATAATAVATPTTTATATATARASGPSALEPSVLPRWSGKSAPVEPKPQPPLGLSLSSFYIKGLGL